ncbi:hypothetical protein D0T84_05335 [Dysgonomonas sp. 521]|uniref:rolling circle replication-associated protein n=1 Tax=Dysgonomonas sp. 521 TaxID=2302932 RepID=UPI0013D65A9A|nr:hypothetical protein [Dysgonomonas sp. 521]NDV94341.1 hypothetical protein [Dysgonomonas sp. 521]
MIKNKKYTATKKNGGKIPPLLDKRVKYVAVACGCCMECMKAKARDWQIRMSEEIKTDGTGKFVTLTFSEESLEELRQSIEGDTIEENDIATLAVRRFLERWRKKHKKSVKHWLVTELGHNGTERIHLHGIIFTDKKEDIELIWQYGYVWVGDYVNERTINYIIKYVHKADGDHPEYKPKVLTSSGIGRNYINRIDSKNNKFKGEDTDEAYRFKNGMKASLPIYYRNKIYNEEEREELWINKLNKQERWVGGERMPFKTYEELQNYENTLKFYQQKSEKLGYPKPKKKEEWDVKKYLNSLRNL